MNENDVNVNSLQGEELDELKKMFDDYQKGNQKTKKRTKEELLAKFFVPRKDKEIFRALPSKSKEKINVAFFHVVATNSKGGQKRTRKIYCPAHNDAPVPKLDDNGQPILDQNGKPVLVPVKCPLCEKYKYILSKQNPALKNLKKEDFKNLTAEQVKIKEFNDKVYKEATKWQAKKFYILRGIDKGAEKDGIKFWRFKHNFKKQGVFDKLIPVLNDFMDQHKVAYYDVNNGCDLNITVIDAEFMGRTYRDVSAISSRGKSLLHTDALIAKQWLEDPITWREVFKPPTAPIISTYEYLEMIAKGEDPYWDDSDSNNKHWVFPNHPDIEAKANTRDMNLDATAASFEYASDVDDEYDGVTISNIKKEDVSTFTDNAVNVTKEINNVVKENVQTDKQVLTPSGPGTILSSNSNELNVDFDPDNIDDLPF